ncbi:putative ABC transport system ATP-binding protein [Maridesulfovibrio ferrireducens]|uniref:Putative ABC transport system ATP-binding protein n=1 Tax=Maridesulfovibrio ferrireducens TaxID=246191 RepID=A0A1G9HNH1_9BACT|nr:ABC transporter ATP-binding protein [Maridesulfovibrio ferrireducens]SDL14346.1 putative ABC transport system ATP-binding protein [Maridesulfovibrio ferrireducens]
MLTIQKAVKTFNPNSVNEVQALREIDLKVDKGDFITIIGSNGAGKSTFLNSIAGSFILSSGKILINNQDVTSWPEHKRAANLGRVFQDPLLGTCTSLTIEQNMALALKRGKRRGLGFGVRTKDKILFREQLSTLGLGLEDRLTDQVGLLSGGQRQALTMIMATMTRPDILLLDEHTAALDPKTGKKILEITETVVSRDNLTTLMVTHNMNQAINMGNRLIMFHQGAIILDISGQEKTGLKVEDLLERFYSLRGESMATDRMLFS